MTRLVVLRADSSPYELLTTGSIRADHPQQPPTRAHDTWTPTPPAPLTSAYATALGSEPEFTNFAMTAWQSAGDPFVGTLDYIFLSDGWKTKEVSHPRVTRRRIHVSRAVACTHAPRDAHACAAGQAAAVVAAHAAAKVVPLRDRAVRPPFDLGGPRTRLIEHAPRGAARGRGLGRGPARQRGATVGGLASGMDPAADPAADVDILLYLRYIY